MSAAGENFIVVKNRLAVGSRRKLGELLNRGIAPAAQFDIEIAKRPARRVEKRVNRRRDPAFAGIGRGPKLGNFIGRKIGELENRRRRDNAFVHDTLLTTTQRCERPW